MADERKPASPWSVSILKITEVLLASSQSIRDTYGQEIPLNDAQYTVIDQRHVYHVFNLM
jgi:hypothetical protein